MTGTYTTTQTFTVTHARYLASKVATDLKRIQRFYGSPSDVMISNYEKEATLFLKEGYLDTVTYGFQRHGAWIEPTLHYTARELAGMTGNDNDPGGVPPGASTSGASFFSFLTYSSAWYLLSSHQQAQFMQSLPIQRVVVPEPSVNGYMSQDRTYSSGGRALDRASVRNY